VTQVIRKEVRFRHPWRPDFGFVFPIRGGRKSKRVCPLGRQLSAEKHGSDDTKRSFPAFVYKESIVVAYSYSSAIVDTE